MCVLDGHPSGSASDVSAHASAEMRSAHDYLVTRASVLSRTRERLALAQERQKFYADRHGRANMNTFSVGDKVLLSTKNLPDESVTNLDSSKLRPRWIGPFEVLEKIGELDYRLDLPTRMRLHPTFYVGLLKPYLDPEHEVLDPQSRESIAQAQSRESIASAPSDNSMEPNASGARPTESMAQPSSRVPPRERAMQAVASPRSLVPAQVPASAEVEPGAAAPEQLPAERAAPPCPRGSSHRILPDHQRADRSCASRARGHGLSQDRKSTRLNSSHSSVSRMPSSA